MAESGSVPSAGTGSPSGGSPGMASSAANDCSQGSGPAEDGHADLVPFAASPLDFKQSAHDLAVAVVGVHGLCDRHVTVGPADDDEIVPGCHLSLGEDT